MISLLLYRILLTLLLPLIIVLLLIRSKNNKAYRQRIAERLGFLPTPMKSGGIIVHAASVGEVIALKNFIEKLLITYPELPITVTSFTPTGSAQIEKLFQNRVQHCYLPLDIYPCTQLFLTQLQPKLMIFMETELWPNLIAQCEHKNIKLLLINARLSAKSMRSYQKVTSLITPCLNRFDKILTQSEENLNNFVQLGAKTNRCSNSGNLKFDIKETPQILAKKAELADLLCSDKEQEKRTVLLAASTHEGDEEIILTAFTQLLIDFPNLLLVIVPRHPERFNTVAELCQAKGLTLVKRTSNQAINNEKVWLLDSLGELMGALALSDIVVMGGSFNHIGGHNPLEPALFKKPVVVGHNMSNFNEIMQQLSAENAIVQLNEAEPATQLTQAIKQLVNDEPRQTSLGTNAHKVVLTNQGASDKTLEQVKLLLSNSSVGDNS